MMLEGMGSSQFRAIENARMDQARVDASYCVMAETFIFASGGKDLRSVERYCIARNEWKQMGKMKVERK